MSIASRRDVRANRRSVGMRSRGSFYTRSESGIGALMPWADKLWITTYPDENDNGGGMGLWSLDEDGDLTLVQETNGTHAGRAVSGDYAFIGQHKIGRDGTVIPLKFKDLTVVVTGSPTDGTFRLTGRSLTTTTIAYNASTATVQAAIRALGTVYANAVVTGTPGNYTVSSIWALLSLTGNALTGGSSPSVAIGQASGTGFAFDDRITSWAKVPGQTPDGNGNVYVYCLTMGGLIYRVKDNSSGTVEFVANGATGLSIAGQPHGKAMWGTPGRLYTVFNINYPDGRLGYYDIAGDSWTRLDNSVVSAATGISFIEVAGSYDGNGHVFALGQDQWTGYMYLIHGNNAAAPRVFLIPLTSRQQTKGWQQEWMRIRQADTTERYLMDFHGAYYALSPFLDSTDGNDYQSTGFPRIEVLGAHSRTTTDFAVFDGKLWLGSNSSSTQSSNKYPNAGQSASILWNVGSVDELISMTRKPRASGAFYWSKAIPATTESLPMMVRGYDKKVVLVKNGTGATSSTITVYGYWGDRKQTLGTVVAAGGAFVTFTIPDGVHPDWVSVSSSAAIDPASIWMDLS